ncbi:hypothetical protein M3J09_013030 [Ascochyta lentis]
MCLLNSFSDHLNLPISKAFAHSLENSPRESRYKFPTALFDTPEHNPHTSPNMKFLHLTSILATAALIVRPVLTYGVPLVDNMLDAELQHYYREDLGAPNDIVG